MNPIHLARIGALLKLPHLLTICFSSPKTALVSCLCMYRKLFFMLSVLWIVNALAPGVKWISFDSGQHPEGSESICFITCQSLKTHTETMAAQNCNLRLIVVLKQSHAQQIIQQTPVSLAHNVVIREASVSISGPFQSLSLCSYSKPVSLCLSLSPGPPLSSSSSSLCEKGLLLWNNGVDLGSVTGELILSGSLMCQSFSSDKPEREWDWRRKGGRLFFKCQKRYGTVLDGTPRAARVQCFIPLL